VRADELNGFLKQCTRTLLSCSLHSATGPSAFAHILQHAGNICCALEGSRWYWNCLVFIFAKRLDVWMTNNGGLWLAQVKTGWSVRNGTEVACPVPRISSMLVMLETFRRRFITLH
jgi:hypothetical protein